MRWVGVASFMLLSGTILAGPAAAQEGLPAQVFACAHIEEAASRHACFDALVPELKRTGASAAQTQPDARSPLTAPVLSAEAKAEKQAEKEAVPDKASFSVKSIATGADGKYRFYMDNGQVWRQLDTIKLRNMDQGPWEAEIRKAALGSFLLTIGKSAAIRVQRVN